MDNAASPLPHPAQPQETLETAGPAALLAAIRALRAAVAAEGRQAHARWRPAIRRPGVAASALNLAHYLALRRRDLRPLQRGLMRHGLSSLGRLEGRVLASLDAVSGALAPHAGGLLPHEAAWPPAPRRFFRGEARLRERTAALFGPGGKDAQEVRILATLPGEAAEDPAWLLDLVRRGVDAVRINCAHDDAAAWRAMAAHARAAGAAVGRRVPVLLDIAGPKIRTGPVLAPEDGPRLRPGDLLLLRRDPPPAAPASGEPPFQAQCLPPEVLDQLRPGAAVAYDDGKAQGVVEAVRPEDGAVLVRVARSRLRGARLRPEKGLNLPAPRCRSTR